VGICEGEFVVYSVVDKVNVDGVESKVPIAVSLVLVQDSVNLMDYPIAGKNVNCNGLGVVEGDSFGAGRDSNNTTLTSLDNTTVRQRVADEDTREDMVEKSPGQLGNTLFAAEELEHFSRKLGEGFINRCQESCFSRASEDTIKIHQDNQS